MRRIAITSLAASSLLLLAAASARAQSVPASSGWSARVYDIELYTQTNAGRVSDHAPKSDRVSSGGLSANVSYGWGHSTEDWRHGAGGIYLDGVLRADGEPGLSLFSPALAARWQGSFHQNGRALHLGYWAGADLRHDSWSMHLRDGWTRHAEASLNWNWNGESVRSWNGYSDFPFFNVRLGGDLQRHDSTASQIAQRAVFDSTWEDAYVGLSGRLVAHDSLSPLRFIKGVYLLGTIRDGDFVSTGPATPDVVAAAHAAVADPSLGNPTPPNDSYRLHARSLILDAEIRIAQRFLIGWTHENDTARAHFTATNDYFYLSFSP